jgi:universal stress protein A
MKAIKKILAPTDLSDLSSLGLCYALELADKVGAEVIVYHVVNRDELMQFGTHIENLDTVLASDRPVKFLLEKYEAALQRFLEKHVPTSLRGAKVCKVVELGRPDKTIIEKAEKESVDLIVISTHGRTGLSHILIGSVAEKVVRQAPCPVLTIRPQKGRARDESVLTS